MSDSDIVAYGELLGAMHVASDGFRPDAGYRPAWSDQSWDEADDSDPELFARSIEIKE